MGGREWEGFGRTSVSERSGLGAIWWRWSEVLKINNLLDISSAMVWPDGPQTKGVLRLMMNVFPDSLELQSVSDGLTDEPEKRQIFTKKDKLALGDAPKHTKN